MKKITLVLFTIMSIFLLSCCAVSEEDNINDKKERFFQDEKFIIVDKNFVDKTWIIERILTDEQDSLYRSELYRTDDGKTHVGSFRISQELWNKKDIGDTLYFEFILKERFFKVKNNREPKVELPTPEEFNEMCDDAIEEIEEEFGHTKIEEMTNLELERKLLELERQLQSIHDEMDQIRYKLENND